MPSFWVLVHLLAQVFHPHQVVYGNGSEEYSLLKIPA
jgi:hypothetical protein